MNIGIIAERALDGQSLSRTILLRTEHEVVWIAESASAAMQLCATQRPDTVLMALPFVEIDGVEMTRRIMSDSPCPILIVTDNVSANAAFVFDAMGHGAMDAVDVPSLGSADAVDGRAPLLAKIDTISRLVRNGQEPKRTPVRLARAVPKPRRDLLVAIGASAGGPAAVATVLSSLPQDFSAAIVIVQHVDAEFVPGIASWLSEQSGRRVSVAQEGDRPAIGSILVAAASGHLILKTPTRLGYTAEPRNCAYRPSVDVFFQSVSRLWNADAIGVLMTGMGKDGAAGLKALREKGHYTIAQDEASSAVYGMPKAAVALDAATDVLPVTRIAKRLLDVATSPSHEG